MTERVRDEHPCFVQPENRNTEVWRYMDMPKFVGVLHTSSLYYSQLSRLEDPLEGTLPKSVLEALAEIDPRLPDNWVKFARSCYVNCWTLHEAESAALWRIYGREDLGIAIGTTYSLLEKAIPGGHFIGLVQYIRRDTQGFGFDHVLSAVMHKGIQYSYEKEVRIVAGLSDAADSLQSDLPKPGISVEIDLSKVIQRVIVSPFAPNWYFDVIEAAVSKFGFSFPVERSEMFSS